MAPPRSRLLTSTPFRLALGLVAAFVLAMTLLLGGAALVARARLLAALEAEMATQLAALEDAPDAATLRDLVAAQAEDLDPERGLLLFRGPDGGVAGNARATPTPGGLAVQGGADDGYLLRTEPRFGGTLVVGRSREPVADLQEALARLLALGLVPTVAAALGAGLLLARRADRRVGAIEAALEAIAAGDLGARAPEARDGTDLDRIARSLNRAAAAQEAAAESLRQVSTDVAHDLRTPLQRLSVLLDRLRARLDAGGSDDDEARALADRAQAEAEGAVALFRALLQIAQIEGGGGPDLAPLRLAPLAAAVADLYEPLAQDGGRSLRFRDASAGRDLLRGDRALLQQALSNLVENALRHTPPGTRVEVALDRRAGRLALGVADDGPGIPAGERDKVQRRLYRLERSRTTPGHGLGLALVAAVARAHGGALRLEDRAPGLRATLDLPAPEAGGDGPGQPPSPRP